MSDYRDKTPLRRWHIYMALALLAYIAGHGPFLGAITVIFTAATAIEFFRS